MDQKSISLLIGAFVALLIGIALIGTIAGEEQALTTTTHVANETISTATARVVSGNITTDVNITLANAPTGWKLTGCALTNFALRNSTGATMTLDTDYKVSLFDGRVSFEDTESMNNTIGESANLSAVNYDYCGDDYVTTSFGRTMLNLVPGFFGLALLAVSIGLFYKVMKNENLLGI